MIWARIRRLRSAWYGRTPSASGSPATDAREECDHSSWIQRCHQVRDLVSDATRRILDQFEALSTSEQKHAQALRDLGASQGQLLGFHTEASSDSVAALLRDVRTSLASQSSTTALTRERASHFEHSLATVEESFTTITRLSSDISKVARCVKWISMNASITAQSTSVGTNSREFDAIAAEIRQLAVEVGRCSSSIALEVTTSRDELRKLGDAAIELRSTIHGLDHTASDSCELLDAAYNFGVEAEKSIHDRIQETDKSAADFERRISEVVQAVQFDDLVNQLLNGVIAEMSNSSEHGEESSSGDVGARDLDVGTVELF